ncbi:MAG: choice-of-anchor J domain-containing protein [Paludibacteraceae bacterium]
MRKITFLFSFLLVVFGISAQTNLITNPSFEDGFTGWTKGPTSSYTEPSLVTSGAQDGNNYVQYVATTATTGFYQEVSISEGKTYLLSFWYKASGDDTDARLWSFLKNAEGNTVYITSSADEDPLRTNNGYLPSAANWTKHEVTFTVPAGSGIVSIQVAVRAYNGGTASYDNFSLAENSSSNISATPSSLNLNATVNTTSDASTLEITGSNLTVAPTYSVTGTDASMFNVTGALTVSGGTLSVTFSPTSLGEKSASLEIVSGSATATVALTGTGTSPGVDSQTFTFKNGLDPWTQYSVTGDQVWVSDPSYGAKMSGYSGGAFVNEDWLISPAFDLSGTVTSASVTFDHAINYIEPADFPTNCTFWISTNYTSGAPSTATWTQLTIPTYPASKGWTFVNSGTINAPASAIGNSNVRVAFKYTSTSAAAGTWEITNLIATVNRPTGVDNVKDTPLTVFGSNGRIVFESTDSNIVEVYNAMGQKIYTNRTVDGLNTININAKGLLIVKVGNRTGKVIL